eukprot:CAMPEP_0177716126 /NCGR_PEP_ID=MMETSP0484_2-20121128/14354_1 /TAXON_ID=354590 /ORGANISM="Rhodomonas lens, Strain RHODO" /LENGTH=179 /DNA_ID=CAMNT_0019228157 /DNA_START=150 /DNA_END=687 /DNA_ORIENTATION=-
MKGGERGEEREGRRGFCKSVGRGGGDGREEEGRGGGGEGRRGQGGGGGRGGLEALGLKPCDDLRPMEALDLHPALLDPHAVRGDFKLAEKLRTELVQIPHHLADDRNFPCVVVADVAVHWQVAVGVRCTPHLSGFLAAAVEKERAGAQPSSVKACKASLLCPCSMAHRLVATSAAETPR